MSSIIPLHPPGAEEHAKGAEEHAKAETERRQRLSVWLERVLREVGLVDRVARAGTLEELRKITFDPDAAEVALAIREALHPASASGAKADYLEGLKEGGIKRLLRKCFDDIKAERETQLRRHGGKQSAHNWTDELKLDDKGGVRPILSNLILFLIHHPKWQGVLGYNEFAARVVIRRRLPWGAETPDAPWTDDHETRTRVWFQNEDIIKAGQGDVGRAVQAAARNNPFHPVRDYLEALTWDGVPRLDTWLIDHCHADDTAYTRAVGRRFPISAVARIYMPGCQVDHMLILEGPQGKQKSTAIRALAVNDAWFTDRLSSVGTKDAAIEVAGAWLVEIAEMEALAKSSASAKKAFLTRRYDRFRPPYGKHLVNLSRQCVFVGTINPPVGGYMKDPTGARRFWPILCDGMIDLDGIKRDRDQLWAEAVHCFKANEKWWMDTPELEALAMAEQDARFKTDVWTEPVKQWLGKRKDVTVSEVLKGALGIAACEQTRSAEMRVADILTHLQFAKYRARDGSKRQNRYWQQ